MSKNRLLILPLMLVVLGLAACATIAGGPAIEAPVEEAPVAEVPAEDTDASSDAPADYASADDPAESDAPADNSAEEMDEEPAAASSGASTFTLVAEETEALFTIDEILNGQPKVVIGTTSDVTGGDITVDFANPAGATVSTLTVDLSTLVTDNNFRNRAMNDVILQSGRPEFQFAEFTVTSVDGMPEQVTVGQPVTFQIIGEMSLHGVTVPLTFDATVTPVSDTRLEGIASTTILYEAFDIKILRLPDQVASVEDTVVLEIQFAAESGG